MVWQFKKYIKDWEKDFSDFCEYTYENLKLYVLKLTAGDRYLAEDIVQDTYMLARINQACLCNHSNPVRWLYSTAKIIFYNKIKDMQTISSTETVLIEGMLDPQNFFVKIEDEVPKITKIGVFLKIFSELPEKDQKLLKDYNIKKKKLKTIAAELGENYGNIKKRYFRLSHDIIARVSSELDRHIQSNHEQQ